MDTKELLDRLRCPGIDACPLQDTRTTCTECQKTVKKEAAEVIEKLSNGAGWISVEERLPEPGERVLATDGGFVGELYVNSRGQWQRYNVNDHSLLMALDILWWMPLPEPPKEEAK